MMKICGLQKTTLLDFPGKVAATVFLGGCSFRCPFCHNSDLLTGDAPELMSDKELLSFLRKRSGVLEGVCITGGEPTLWPEECARLMREIRNLGYQIKLDTNGYRPEVLKALAADGLVDYVAMDIKAGRFHYAEVCGREAEADFKSISAGAAETAGARMAAGGFHLERIEESVSWLMEEHVPYEFRTTVVKGIHTAKDFEDIADWIGGCKQYFLQGFVDSGNVLKPGFESFRRTELEAFLRIVSRTIPAAEIRGVDY